MAELPEPSELDNLVPPNTLSLSKSPRAARGALQLNPAEHEILEKVVRKHIIRRRWYGLLNIIFLRIRQQNFGLCAIMVHIGDVGDTETRRLIRRKWRKLIASTLSDSRKKQPKPAAAPPPPPSYQFGQPDSEATIVIAKEPDHTGQAVRQVKYATPEKAVEHLTFPIEHCPGFSMMMLLTYPMFLPSSDFLNLLILRFQQSHDIAIKAHVIETMKLWVECNFDWNIETNFGRFLEAHKDANTAFRGKGSMKVLRNIFDIHKKDPLPIEAISVQDTPKPLCSKTPAAKLEAVDPLEIARQLALLDEEYYRSLRVREFLNMAWCKSGKEVHAPNLLAIISRFNELSCWAAFQVLKAETVPERIVVLTHLVKVAKHCRALRNYNGLMSLLSGLTGTNVGRLKNTWAGVSTDTMKDLEDLRNLMKLSGNYQGYREELKELAPTAACQPFLAPFLSDLTFIDENPKIINGMVNFIKCRLVYQVVTALLRFRDNTFNFEPVPWLQSRIMETGMPLTEEGLYQLSLKREPRQGAAPALPTLSAGDPAIDLSISQKISNFIGRSGPEKRATGRQVTKEAPAAIQSTPAPAAAAVKSPGPEKRSTMFASVDLSKTSAGGAAVGQHHHHHIGGGENEGGIDGVAPASVGAVIQASASQEKRPSSSRKDASSGGAPPVLPSSILVPTSADAGAPPMQRKDAVAKMPDTMIASSGSGPIALNVKAANDMRRDSAPSPVEGKSNPTTPAHKDVLPTSADRKESNPATPTAEKNDCMLPTPTHGEKEKNAKGFDEPVQSPKEHETDKESTKEGGKKKKKKKDKRDKKEKKEKKALAAADPACEAVALTPASAPVHTPAKP